MPRPNHLLALTLAVACGDGGDTAAPIHLETCEEVRPEYANCTRSSLIDSPSGWVFQRGTVTYGPDGWPRSERIEDGEGTVTTDYANTFDDRIRLVHAVWQDDAEIPVTGTFTWDDCRMDQESYDTDEDGVADTFQENLYDDQGRHIGVVGTGEDVFRISIEYVEDTVTERLDLDDDGTIDRIETTTLVGNNPVRYELDEDGDGTAELVETKVWKGDDYIERTRELFVGYAGTLGSEHEVRTFGEHGLDEVLVDRDIDGVLDLHYKYSWDALGRVVKIRVEHDPTGSFQADQRFFYTYDCPM